MFLKILRLVYDSVENYAGFVRVGSQKSYSFFAKSRQNTVWGDISKLPESNSQVHGWDLFGFIVMFRLS